MRHLALLALLSLCACAWPPIEPTPRWPAPPGFGFVAWEGAILRTPEYSSIVSDQLVYVSVLERAGRDAKLNPATEATQTLLALDPRANTTRTLPASPLPNVTPSLWPAAGGVIATLSSRIVRFDGTTWTELPTLPTPSPDFVRGLAGGYVLVRKASLLWVFGNGTWRPVSFSDLSITSPVFGPTNGTDVRVIYWHGSQGLCTAARALSDLSESRPPVCLANQSELPGGEVMNGSFDDFQSWTPSIVDVQLWHFANDQWTRGVAVRGSRLRWTPDAAFAVGSIDVTGTFALQNLTKLEAGRASESLFVQSWELLGCDGELRTCARLPGFIQELVESDGSGVLFLIENLVDARRVLYVKRMALPHRDGGSCSPTCAAGQLCVRGSGIANLCVADPALAP